MRNFILTIAVSLASTVVMAFSIAARMKVEPVIEEPLRPLALEVITPKIEAPKVEIIIKFILIKIMLITQFLERKYVLVLRF